MEIELRRDLAQAGHRTFGKFYLDNVFTCETLEPPVREVEGVVVSNWKLREDTAIPRGRYRVIINRPRGSGLHLPLLLNVPGFDDVRIGPDDSRRGLDGWILVGVERSDIGLLDGRRAFHELFQDIHDALNTGEQVWITVG